MASVAPDEKKRRAAFEALRFVKPGMVLGLGTGSTVQFFLEGLAERIKKEGWRVKGIPTSLRTEAEAKRLGIPVTTLDESPRIDLTVDGADEVDPRLNLIKGGGGALVREKVVATSSSVVVIIADDSKFVARLGSTFPVPVEVLPFARVLVERGLGALGGTPSLRLKDGRPYVTDNGGWILDARFRDLPSPAKMEQEITMMAGVIDCGIFTGLADVVLLGTDAGVKQLQVPRQVRAELA